MAAVVPATTSTSDGPPPAAMPGHTPKAPSAGGGIPRPPEATFRPIRVITLDTGAVDTLLTERQRRFLFHLQEACLHGHAIALDQQGAFNTLLSRHFATVLRHADALVSAHPQAGGLLLAYILQFFAFHGVHGPDGRKLVPLMRMQDFAQALMWAAAQDDDEAKKSSSNSLTSSISSDTEQEQQQLPSLTPALAWELTNYIFHPELAKTKSALQNIYISSRSHFTEYELLNRVQEQLARNATFEATSDTTFVEHVWRSDHPTYGRAIDRICASLRQAALFADNEEQAQGLLTRAEQLASGDLAQDAALQQQWVRQRCLVDAHIGFLGTQADMLQRKGLFVGLTWVMRKESAELGAVLHQYASWFETQCPYSPNLHLVPRVAYTADVVTAAGLAYPLLPPMLHYGSSASGFKFVLFANALRAQLQELDAAGLYRTFLTDEQYARLLPHLLPAKMLLFDIHETLGHISGIVHPQAPRLLSADTYMVLDECKAVAYSLHILGLPRLQELGFVPGGTALVAAAYELFLNENCVWTPTFSTTTPHKTTSHHTQEAAQLAAVWILTYGLERHALRYTDKMSIEVLDVKVIQGAVKQLLAKVQHILEHAAEADARLFLSVLRHKPVIQPANVAETLKTIAGRTSALLVLNSVLTLGPDGIVRHTQPLSTTASNTPDDEPEAATSSPDAAAATSLPSATAVARSGFQGQILDYAERYPL